MGSAAHQHVRCKTRVVDRIRVRQVLVGESSCGRHVKPVVDETMDVAHARDQVRAGGRTDKRERHRFLDALVPWSPRELRPEGIGRAIDRAARGIGQSASIEGIEGKPGQPIAEIGLGVVEPEIRSGRYVVRAPLKQARPMGAGIFRQPDRVTVVPAINGRHRDPAGMVPVDAETHVAALGIGTASGRHVGPLTGVGVELPYRAARHAVRTYAGAVVDVERAVGAERRLCRQHVGRRPARNRAPAAAAVRRAEQVLACGIGNAGINPP